ncbi:hypothetical protein sos41_14810 [Alphaproteobacteria bacterium SO-S41]|nr:hypothetical protein sos41_14810 [Alphaproteobacteria bacterium SO-S41]
MFHKMGHFVFPLGVYFGGRRSEGFRPEIDFRPDVAQYTEQFLALGGKFRYGSPASSHVITREFVELFDVVVVMHDSEFIKTHWAALSARPVIWRTIGVDTVRLEYEMADVRAMGCVIVRYCPKEAVVEPYLGHDAIIRFPKQPDDFAEWQGDGANVLTFSNTMRQRFEKEAAIFSESVRGLKAVIGGIGNDGMENAIGLVEFAEQLELLKTSRAYYYCAGSHIPYTLNFIEAWMSGIPLVALDCRAVHAPDVCRFAEVPHLIEHEKTGFLVENAEDANAAFRRLIEDPALAKKIGQQGREAAKALFSHDAVSAGWSRLFSRMGL